MAFVVPALGDRIDGRFEVRSVLGEGTEAIVLEVWDPFHDTTRALKLAKRLKFRQHLAREYERLTELRHPNIVRAYDLGTHRRYSYLTLEMLRGVPLNDFPAAADPEVLAVVTLQALDALATLHARGWIHRDLKPGNLMIIGKGSAALLRLIDFGLSIPAGKARRGAGSLPYVAPEIARGEAADGRADLYSLGVLLYEALLPQRMHQKVEDIAAWFAKAPPPVRDLDPLIPSGFSDFVATLVNPDPADRFPNALKAAEALSEISAFNLSRGPSHPVAERLLRGGAVAHRPHAISKLRKVARRVAKGEGATVIVEGAMGAGKTPLLREFGVWLNRRGFRVAHMRVSTETGAPVPRLLRIVRAFGEDLVFEGAADSWRSFPGRVALEVGGTLGDRSTALIIDDLQKAEPIALDVVRELALAVRSLPILLVVAGDTSSELPSLSSLLRASGSTIALRPLSVEAIKRLLNHRFANIQLPIAALERIEKDSQGMPSLVEKIAAGLVAEGTISCPEQSFEFSGGRYHASRHSDETSLALRLAGVGEVDQRVLWSAAVVGRHVDAERVARVGECGILETERSLARLAQRGLLSPTEASAGMAYRFADRALHRFVYGAIPTEQRRRFHDLAADAVSSGRRTLGRLEERVEHLLKGSKDSEAVAAALEAAERAASVYADRRAIEYYARAYSRMQGEDDPRSTAVALELGRLFARSGELERASVWYSAASPGAPETRVRSEIGLGHVALIRGLPDEALHHARRALVGLPELSTGLLSLEVHRLLARVELLRGRYLEAETFLREAMDATEDPREHGEIYTELANVTRTRGELMVSIQWARKAIRIARRLKNAALLSAGNMALSQAFLRAGRGESARRFLVRALSGARASGDRLREALVLREVGHVRYLEGDLEGALERYGESAELIKIARARSQESAVLHDLGRVRSLRGELGIAVSVLSAAVEAAELGGDRRATVKSHLALAMTFHLAGLDDRAFEHVERAWRNSAATEPPVLSALCSSWRSLVAGAANLEPMDVIAVEDRAERSLVLSARARFFLERNQWREARSVLEIFEATVDDGGIEVMRPELEMLLGKCAALSGDRATAARYFESASKAAQFRGMTFIAIEALSGSAAALAGLDEGLAAATRGMELLRELCAGLPADFAHALLSRHLSTELRAVFRRERDRVSSEMMRGDSR